MSDIPAEWIEAGARALWGNDGTEPIDEDYRMASRIIEAVEPLIRADEHRKIFRLLRDR